MDIDKELEGILGPRGGDLRTLSRETRVVGVANAHETRREHESVNRSILTSAMHDWSDTIEALGRGDAPRSRAVSVATVAARGGVRVEREGRESLSSGIARLLAPSVASPSDSEAPALDPALELASRLRVERANRLRHEQMMARARSTKKIKSKNFHRHSVKRSIHEYLRQQDSQPGRSLATEIERLDKKRAEERISLKHRSGGKFERMQKLRAKYDSLARENLSEMRRKGGELTKRAHGDADDDDEEEEEIDDMEEDSESDFETVAISGGSTLMENSSTHKNKSFTEENRDSNPKERATVSSVLCTDQSADWETNDPEAEDLFKQAVLEVYSKDDQLAAEFEREKNELAKKEAPEDVDMCLLGWGSFTGPGLEAADKRRKRQARVKAPKITRQDEAKPRVWIKETLPEGIHKHLIKSIPYPYNTAEQFNLSRKELVSSSFNLQTVHRKLVKPRFHNKAGHFIYPTKEEEKIIVE